MLKDSTLVRVEAAVAAANPSFMRLFPAPRGYRECPSESSVAAAALSKKC